MQLDSFTLPGAAIIRLTAQSRQWGGGNGIAVKIFWINQAPGDARIPQLTSRSRTLFPLGAMGANGHDMLLAIYDLDN